MLGAKAFVVEVMVRFLTSSHSFYELCHCAIVEPSIFDLHYSNPICPVEFRVHILALPTYFGCKSAQGPNAFPIVAPLLTTLAQLDCASEVVFQ
jgi:hypothetical protein